MSGKASSDFGLYRERQQQNHAKSLKLVLVIGVMAASGLGILYLILHLTRNNHHLDPLEVTIEKPAQTGGIEKLISAGSLRRELSNLPAKPFGLTYRGEAPAEFAPVNTKSTTPSNYPQLEVYRHKYFPKNIQDVIGHAMPRPLRKPSGMENQRAHVRFPNPPNYKESPSQKNFSYVDNTDPFYSYKPQDPSDINLMATASFRFAPPYWSTIKQKLYHPQDENPNMEEIYRPPYDQNNPDGRRPMLVTLNIYPENGDKGRLFRNQLDSLDPRLRMSHKPKKMIIRLNLYPEPNVGLGMDYRETKLHNVVFPPE